ncbi:MAG: polysaccharide biosynthesis/export family protein [Flavobacteriaceae bacterium]|nr:polysaccharide biosynthesis/export family protein [Flavobacteriaceae bacterium]
MAIVFLSSCASRKDIVYFQDEPISKAIDNKNADFELIFNTNDLLTINVSALDSDAARPFNFLSVASNGSSVIDASGASSTMQSYLIDAKGNIEFPVLGTIKLGGLTKSEAIILLKQKLIEYLNNPIVNIRLVNFTITVLGEVNSPGTYTINGEKISLTEAIGYAGDLTIYGNRKSVFLIRELDGEKRFSKFDLTSINVVNHPNYYLFQNDVIYVAPNKTRINQASDSPNTRLILSAVGLLATITAILIR